LEKEEVEENEESWMTMVVIMQKQQTEAHQSVERKEKEETKVMGKSMIMKEKRVTSGKIRRMKAMRTRRQRCWKNRMIKRWKWKERSRRK
jgi:hypothetical protein